MFLKIIGFKIVVLEITFYLEKITIKNFIMNAYMHAIY
jgi:hypothetical protein